MSKKSQFRHRRTFLRTLAAAPMISALGMVDAQEAASPRQSAEGDAQAEIIRFSIRPIPER